MAYRQEITFHKDTYTIRSLKEYKDDALVAFELYDKNEQRIYRREGDRWKKYFYHQSGKLQLVRTSQGFDEYYLRKHLYMITLT